MQFHEGTAVSKFVAVCKGWQETPRRDTHTHTHTRDRCSEAIPEQSDGEREMHSDGARECRRVPGGESVEWAVQGPVYRCDRGSGTIETP
jgi:hypothetical protein